MTDKQILNDLREQGEEMTLPGIQAKYKISNSKARSLKFALSVLSKKEIEEMPTVDKIPETKKESIPGAKLGINEKELRMRHDNRFIIQEKARTIEKDKFLTTAEFIQFCRLKPSSGYKQAIEHPEFEKYHGKAGGVTYWSHPESINKMKEEGVLT